jgi:hypothetical protein
VDDSDFTQFVEVIRNLEDDNGNDTDFILESEHCSESEQSANDNENDLELVPG